MTDEGISTFGHCDFPGRGTTYYLTLAGHDLQLYVTEKRKKLRVFVDYKEWSPK